MEKNITPEIGNRINKTIEFLNELIKNLSNNKNIEIDSRNPNCINVSTNIKDNKLNLAHFKFKYYSEFVEMSGILRA